MFPIYLSIRAAQVNFTSILLQAAFFANVLLPKNTNTNCRQRKAVQMNEIAACKMLVIFTPGVNFTYVLLAAFAILDPKSVEKYS